MVKKILLSMLWAVSAVQFCDAMEYCVSDINDIDDIPHYCTELAKKLLAQPPCEDCVPVERGYKILPLQESFIAFLCSELSDNAQSCFKNARISFSVYRPAIMLCVHDDYEICSMEMLECTYAEIIKELKNGWHLSTIDENPDVFSKYSEEEWYLFTKKECLFDESSLVGTLIVIFGLGDGVKCHHEWNDGKGGLELRDTYYLWVNQDALKAFAKKLKFNITQPVAEILTSLKKQRTIRAEEKEEMAEKKSRC